MKYLILILFFIAGASEVKAETVISLHTISYHQNRAANYNEENYGFGLRHYIKNKSFHYVNIGTYKNSEQATSKYIGAGWEWNVGELKIGVNMGLIDGYSLSSVLPYVVPVISYKNINVIFASYPEAVVHLTIDLMGF